jgi:hypothetical protein
MRRTFNHRRWPRSANREEIAMTRIALVALALSAAMTLPAVAADYKIVERFKMPDGGWDYASSDPIKGLIYWSRNEGFTDVIDAKTGKLSQLKSTGNGHLAVPVAGTTLVVLPDGATYDPFSMHVFVADRDPSEVTEVDPLAGKSTTFSVGGGKLEFPASDGLGRLFVNRSQAGEIAVIDIKTQKVTATYKMAACDDPSGLAYADRAKLLVSSCNGLAKVLAAETGKEVASIPIGKGPDAVIYDAVRQLAFIPCGADGVLEIISLADPSHVALLQHLPTHILARTGAVDLQSGRVYLMSAEPDPSKPRGGGGRPTPKDGSFEMLVIGPQ